MPLKSNYSLHITYQNHFMKNMNSYLYLCLSMVLLAFCSNTVQAQDCVIQGGLVLNDGSDANTIDANDHMQVYVGVNLYEDSDCDGTIDSSDDLVASGETNSLGFFEFSVDDAACYIVEVAQGDLPGSATFLTGGGTNTLAIDLTDGAFDGTVCSDNNFLAYSGGSTTCFGVADGGVDLTYWFNRFTGEFGIVGPTGVQNIEATARDMAGVLWAVNQMGDDGFLGTIDINTGAFTAFPNPIGAGISCFGDTRQLNDVDALSFDPITGELYAVVRSNMFLIDPITGMFIPNAMTCADGTQADFIEVTGLPTDWVDDIAIDFNGTMFAVNNDDGSNDVFVEIDKMTGAATVVGVPHDENGDDVTDIEGLSFNNDGTFYATTGDQSDDPTQANKVWEVVITGNDVLMIPIVCFDNVNTDMEGEECLDGPGVSLTNPEDIGFCLLEDGCPDFSTGIDIEVSTNGNDADSSTGADVPTITEGGTVTWTYTVTNTGNTTLTNVTVTDDVLGTICVIAEIAAGATETCTASGLATAGLYSNTGSASGTPVDEAGNVLTDLGTPTDSDPSHYTGEALPCDVNIALVQDCDEDSGILTATYTFTGGSGTYTISGDVNDTFVSGESFSTTATSGEGYEVNLDDGAGCVTSSTGIYDDCVKTTVCDLSIDLVEDCDEDTGTLTATYTFSGGSGNYEVTGDVEGIFVAGDTFTAEAISNTNVTINVNDGTTCSGDFFFTFQDCVKTELCDLAVSVAEDCDDSTGTLNVTYTFSGGSGTYSVSGAVNGAFSNGDTFTGEAASGASTSVTVDDGTDCSDTFDFDLSDCVKVDDCSGFGLVEVLDCNPEDGVSELTLSGTGGVAPYTISGDINVTLAAGEVFTTFYSGAINLLVVISDASDCSESVSVEYEDCVKGALTCDLIELDIDSDCDPGTGVAEVTFTVSGSVGPYTITGSFDSDASGAFEIILDEAGSFVLPFTDETAITSLQVTTPDCSETFDDVDLPDCVKVCDVVFETDATCDTGTGILEVTYTVGGGTEPYTLTDSNGNVLGTANENGTIVVGYADAFSDMITVTDSGECTESYPVSFEDCEIVPVCDLSIGLASQMCDMMGTTVTISFDVDGGVAPYLASGANGTFVGDDFILEVASGADVPAFVVTDGEGCTATFDAFTAIPCADPCTPISVDVTDEDCDEDTGVLTVTWDIDGGSQPYVITGDITPTVVGDDFTATFDDAATVNFTVTDANNCPFDFTFSFDDCEIDLVQNADLELIKNVDTDSAQTGETVTYTIRINNDGDDVATGVTVLDQLPSCVSYVSSSADLGSYDPSTGIWNVGTLPAPAVQGGTPFYFFLTIVAEVVGTSGDCCNIAEIATSDQPDDDSEPGNEDGDQGEDDEDKAVFEIEEIDNTIDLELNKSVDDSTVDQGDEVVYTITINNDGPLVATGVQVGDNLPSCVSYISSSAEQGSYDASTGIWNVGTVGVNEFIELTIVAEATGEGECCNIAEVVAADQEDDDSEPNNDNGDQSEDDEDKAVIDIDVAADVADLALNKTISDTDVENGDLVTYTISVTNQGPDNATGVEVEDDLPSCVDFVSADGNYSSTSGIWNIGSIAVGETVELEIVAEVNSNGGSCTNSAEVVDMDQDDDDSTPNNDEANEDDQDTASFTIIEDDVADLELDKSVDDNNVEIGQTITYTITVTNDGPDNATGVEVEDDLPSCVDYVSSSTNDGDYDSGSGIWDIGSIADGETVELEITAVVVGPEGCRNIAQVVSSDQDDDDSTPDNNDDDEDDYDGASITIDDGPDCEAEAGQITGAADFYCHDEDVSVDSDGFNTSNDFTQAYLLVDEFEVVVDFNTDGDFGNPTPGTYCIHPLNFDGGLMFGIGTSLSAIEDMNACLDLGSDCTQVTVLSEVTIDVEEVDCDETTGTYTLAFTFLGGLPEFDASETYNADGAVDGDFFFNETVAAEFTNNSTYEISSSDANGCGASATGSVECIKMSVELIEFAGRTMETENLIYWSTATEENTDFFTVEYSVNGQDFFRLGDVQAAGFSNTTMSYEMKDTDPSVLTYYRLVEYTFEGVSTVVSDVIALERDDKGFHIEGINPVPVVDVLNIDINVKDVSSAQIMVFDVTGRMVITTQIDLEAGMNAQSLDMSNVAGGAYFLQVVSGNQVQSLKFLKD